MILPISGKRILLPVFVLALSFCCPAIHGEEPREIASGTASGTFPMPASSPESRLYVTTPVLANLLKGHGRMSLLDARRKNKQNRKRIPGSKDLSIESPLPEIRATLPEKDMRIIVYSDRAEASASAVLFLLLRDLGYPYVLEYPGGLDEWESGGEPTE